MENPLLSNITFQELNKIFTVPVKKIVKETEDALSVYLDITGIESFKYIQGQHLNIHFDINGKHYSRAYSLFTAPFENEVAITVKRVKDGIVSNYINDHVKAETLLQVNLPRGNFYSNHDEKNTKNYFFFGGGSGITPLLSNIKMILKNEPLSKVYFLYGNRNKESIIHFSVLEQLKQQYSNRLIIQYELETEKGILGRSALGNIFGLKTGWIDKRCVLYFLNKYHTEQESEYFICGPFVVMDNVEQVLHSIDINKKKIHIERFGTNSTKLNESKNGFIDKVELTFTKEGIKKSITVDGNKSLFQTLTDAGEDIDHSCLAGSCASCVCIISKGEVEMKHCDALNETQLKDNFILTCQAHPLTDKVEINFDMI